MSFIRFTDLSQNSTNTDFQSTFSNTNLSGSSNLNSLSGEFEAMCRLVRMNLGEPVLTVEISNEQINSAFERSNLEYSRILSTIQIGNYFSTIMGLSREYSENDLKNILPYETFSFMRRNAKNYGIFGPTPVGGNVDIRRGYVSVTPGKQDYNIYTDLFDAETGLNLGNYVLSNSANPASVTIAKLYHNQPLSLNRGFDLWSSNNYNVLSTEMPIESYAGPNYSSYYVMPVWNDILRGQVNRQSDLVRRSNYSYNQFGNRLILLPTPKHAIKVFFEYFQDPDAFHSGMESLNHTSLSSSLTGSLSGGFDNTMDGINAFWNVPMKDINYEEMNPVSRQWIREYTIAICKELLGDIRGKYASIPLPNGDVQLNGADLVQRGIADQTRLREELKTDLEKFKKVNLMKEEAEMAQALNDQLKFFPLVIQMG